MFFLKNGVLNLLLILSTLSFSFGQNLKYADSLLATAMNTNLNKKEKAILLTKVANFHPNIAIALASAKESLQIALQINDLILQAEAWEEISNLELKLGNNSLSLTASFKALKIYESLKLPERQASSYSQLAGNYFIEKEYPTSIKYYKKSITIYNNLDQYGYLPIAILNLGEAYRLSGSLDSALFYFKKSLDLKKDADDQLSKVYALGNLGLTYAAQGNLTEAQKTLIESLKLLKNQDDYYSSTVYTSELGRIYLKEKKYILGKQKLQEALLIAQKFGLKEQIRDISKILSNFHESQKEYNKALNYQKLFQIYQDSLVNKHNVKKIEQLKADYEIDKRETEIHLLNQINSTQKKWVYSLFIGISVLFLLSYLLYIGNKKITRKNNLLFKQKEIISKREQEKIWLLRELNHRVKNNLQMISSLLSLQSNKLSGHPAQEAIISGQQRVEALSLVHRKLYQEGVDTRIYIKEYISELVHGLFHAYQANFEPEIIIDDVSVNIDTAIPLALIINEIIINALKYAYKGIEKPSLRISAQSKQQQITIKITDNGIGFNKNTINETNSLGLKIINSLILQLEGTIQHDNTNGTSWEMNFKTNFLELSQKKVN